jgi:hypothetical protein
VDLRSGRDVWSVDDDPAERVAALTPEVVVLDGRARLSARAREDGRLLWRAPRRGAPPGVEDAPLAFAAGASVVYQALVREETLVLRGLDLATGATRFEEAVRLPLVAGGVPHLSVGPRSVDVLVVTATPRAAIVTFV